MWLAIVCGVTESQTRLKGLSMHSCKKINDSYLTQYIKINSKFLLLPCRYFTHGRVYNSVLLSQFVPPYTSPHCVHKSILYICVSILSVTKLCLTLCDPMDCSPPGFSVHEILQARILEWVAISFSNVSILALQIGSSVPIFYN